MLAPLSWLQEFAPFEGDPAALAEVMTDLGMVVEEITTFGNTWDGIIVAKVLSLNPHPNADKIQLVGVDVGNGESLQICCGAFNMSVGDLVPLATEGTTMPSGMEIAAREMRGEASNGMLCSAGEIGVPGDDSGIHLLDASLALGTPLSEALGQTSDTVFDLELEGNRPDALSIVGVARDLAARLGLDFSAPTPSVVTAPPSAAGSAAVEIQSDHLCKRFGFRVLRNVTLGQSPLWMASRLTAAGMRPINSIVDISNYVMLELGQPNHTYDLDLVADGKLVVRMGRDGERIVTLDSIERNITELDGVIANAADEPIGLAGVMGGESTEIGSTTTSVLLEAAIWDRMTIAKTTRRLNLRSEASTRYERGVDYDGVARALDRFCELAVEICGAEIADGAVIVDGALELAPIVRVRTDRVNSLINTALSDSDIISLLTPIGFIPTVVAAGQLDVQVPSWRPDSTIEVDIIEEIARHNGYAKSGTRVPTPAQTGELSPLQKARRQIRQALLGAGYSEVMPMPFLAPGDIAKAGLSGDGITLTNPLAAEESVLRISLLPGLLKTVSYNQSHRSGPIQLFELGTVYHRSDNDLPDEPEWLAAVASGFDSSGAAAASAVRLVHRLAETLGLANLTLINEPRDGLHPTRSAEIKFRGKTIGEVGEVDPGVLEAYEVDGRVAWLQLDTASVVASLASVPKHKQISRYPSSEFDLSFVVPKTVPVDKVLNTIRKAGGKLVVGLALTDAFHSAQLGSDSRSLSFALRLQASDRTLTEAEVNEVRAAAIAGVAKQNGGELRS